MQKDPAAIVAAMMKKDRFSQWLGIEVLAIEPGYCRLQMALREEMCNGFGIAHGGICYSLADSALAFASNSRGKQALSVNTSIAHLKTLQPGDRIVATAKEVHQGNNIRHYEVRVENEGNELVAVFNGTVFITSKEW